MDAQQFAYWLQGFAELTNERPTAEQWKSIQEHLATVFVKVTPPVTGGGFTGTLDGYNQSNLSDIANQSNRFNGDARQSLNRSGSFGNGTPNSPNSAFC